MDSVPPPRFDTAALHEALALTGRLLRERGQQFEIVVIGGANLALQGLVDRVTEDVDVVAQRASTSGAFECAKPLPPDLERAVSDAARLLELPAWWMNGSASSDFALGLPVGYEDRASPHTFGALTVLLADRRDIVAWKLQAAVDNLGSGDKHLQDLRVLAPTLQEIAAAREWFTTVEGPASGFWSNLDVLLRELDNA